MQKILGIVAIAAMSSALPQLVLAQSSQQGQTTENQATQNPSTLSQTSRDQSSSSIQRQVMNNLAQAGYTNIRIMPESFLVRATDRDGNPVMMLINPDSITAVTAAANDQGNTASPAQEGQTTAKSAKMTDNQANSGSRETAEQNQSTSQSAKMQAAGPNQNAENESVPGWPPGGTAANGNPANMSAAGSGKDVNSEKVPGRSNGMVAELKQDESHSLKLSVAQRADIWKALGSKAGQAAPAGFEPKVGEAVPNSVQLRSLPGTVTNQVPAVKPYEYAMLHSQLLIVDPSTKKVVAIITE